MKLYTTNYTNAFIETAEDCPASAGEAPPYREPETAAQIEYKMLSGHPYLHTSDDVIYASSGKRKGISREDFFAKGQPCLRSSALTKRYGWGIHSDALGRVAMYGVGTEEYKALSADEGILHLRAMRTKKA